MSKKMRVPDSVWANYNKIVQDFIDTDAGCKPITWVRHNDLPKAYGEDGDVDGDSITIPVLTSYNVFKTWPSNKSTISGELDMQSLAIFISKSYLNENHYINSDGYWDFNRALDRFIINGIVYKSSGDTSAAQAKDDDLLFMVVLKREEKEV